MTGKVSPSWETKKQKQNETIFQAFRNWWLVQWTHPIKKVQILLAMPLFWLDKNNQEMQLTILKKPLRNTTASFVTLQSRMNVSIPIKSQFLQISFYVKMSSHMPWWSWLFQLYQKIALCVAMSLKISCMVQCLWKKKHIIEMGGFLWDDQDLLIK